MLWRNAAVVIVSQQKSLRKFFEYMRTLFLSTFYTASNDFLLLYFFEQKSVPQRKCMTQSKMHITVGAQT